MNIPNKRLYNFFTWLWGRSPEFLLEPIDWFRDLFWSWEEKAGKVV